MTKAKNQKRLDISSPGLSGNRKRSPTLLVDGIPADHEKAKVEMVFPTPAEELGLRGEWSVHIADNELAQEVEVFSFDDIGSLLGVLSLPFRPDWNQYIDRIYIVARKEIGEEGAINLVFSLTIWPQDWANPFTVADYMDALEKAIEESLYFEEMSLWGISTFPSLDDDGDKEGTHWSIGIASTVRSVANSISEEIGCWSERLAMLCEVAVRSVLKSRKDALVTFFDFPASLKTACEQYLVYFIQFLEDLGISADSEIKQDAGFVMFSVVPRDGVSALENIKEALSIYLGLPGEHEFNQAANQFSDIAVIQLRANVFFLQSQLELARAVIEAKDATIQTLSLLNYQQRQLLTSSSEEVAPHRFESQSLDKEEPLLGNAISVTTYEGKGFKINLPLILRRLKRAFGS